MVGKRTFSNTRDYKNDEIKDDIESNTKPRRFPRFRDAVDFAVAERNKTAIKKQLLDEVNRDEWEEFRKSDEEV